MKFININKSIKALIMACTMFTVFSCEDTSKAPIVTFATAGHGAYPRLLTETGAKLMNILSAADFTASQYGYTIEFVDENGGKDVAQYILKLEYDDNDASNGDLSVSDITLRTYTPSDWSENAEGFQELANIIITAGDVAAATGITFADITAGDNFNISGEVHMNNGDVFTSVNSSSSVEGTAFRGHFSYTLPAACPSDLGGTYDVSTVHWCGGPTVGTVDIVDQGGGTYQFSDWSFGGYGVCWGGGAASGDFTFVEVCTVVTLNDGTDSFGDSWTFSSVISGNDWIITWLNFTYAAGLENGVTTITFPGGVPFTLAP